MELLSEHPNCGGCGMGPIAIDGLCVGCGVIILQEERADYKTAPQTNLNEFSVKNPTADEFLNGNQTVLNEFLNKNPNIRKDFKDVLDKKQTPDPSGCVTCGQPISGLEPCYLYLIQWSDTGFHLEWYEIPRAVAAWLKNQIVGVRIEFCGACHSNKMGEMRGKMGSTQ